MVANMEDTFSKGNSWRAVNNVFIYHLLYLLIIAWELSVAALVMFGTLKMINKRRASVHEFKSAKRYVSWGLSLGILLWFTVFITIGGEWFLMWQSKTWNAQSTVFFLTCIFLLFLIYHNQEQG
jgi:predicted small integral membrane protein